MDERWRPAFATPFQPTSVQSLLAGAKAIEVVPIREGFVHSFDAALIAVLKRESLDVILRFGFNIISGDILSVANIWRLVLPPR